MTQKQAWLEIATAFELPMRERSEEQKKMTQKGLCAAIEVLVVDSFKRYIMYDRLAFYRKSNFPAINSWYHFYPNREPNSACLLPSQPKKFYRKYDLLRAKIARELAEKCD